MENLILSELCVALDANILDLDLQASFIQNGGHSLAAAALVSACKAHGCHITIKSILMSGSIRECISSAKMTTIEQSELTYVSTAESSVNTSPRNYLEPPPDSDSSIALDEASLPLQSSTLSPPITVQSRALRSQSTISDLSSPEVRSAQMSSSSMSSSDDQESQGELTDMQRSLIHGYLKTPGVNVISCSETYYTKDVPVVKMAWKTVIDMEYIFRYPAFDHFRSDDYEHFSWHEESSLFNDQETRKAIDILSTQSGIGSAFYVFPQKSAPSGEPLSTVTWMIHHAFVDGFSASLLLNKVRRITAGIAVKPGFPFSHFSAYLQELRRSLRKEGNAYWAEKSDRLNSASHKLLLPAVAEDSVQSPCDEVVLDVKTLRKGLGLFSKEANVTPATIFNVAWALVLSKYCDSKTIKYGVILSGRDLPLTGVREIVGPVMNTLPLCITIDPDSSVKSFASSMMANLVELGEFQWTTPENGFCNDFESALAVQIDQMAPPKDSIEPIGETATRQATEIPLSIMVEHERIVRFTFRRDRYSKASISGVSACYYRTLQLLLHEDISLTGILQGILPLSTRNMLLRYGNCISDRTTKTSITQDLVTLFEQSVRNGPDSLAVEKGRQFLTYKSLDNAASRFAEYLCGKICTGDIVCVHSDRSINWIIAIYGILKAGATYCSLDTSLPPELRDSMFTNAGAKAFVLPHSSQRNFCPISCKDNIALDEILEKTDDTRKGNSKHREQPNPWYGLLVLYLRLNGDSQRGHLHTCWTCSISE